MDLHPRLRKPREIHSFLPMSWSRVSQLCHCNSKAQLLWAPVGPGPEPQLAGKSPINMEVLYDMFYIAKSWNHRRRILLQTHVTDCRYCISKFRGCQFEQDANVIVSFSTENILALGIVRLWRHPKKFFGEGRPSFVNCYRKFPHFSKGTTSWHPNTFVCLCAHSISLHNFQ